MGLGKQLEKIQIGNAVQREEQERYLTQISELCRQRLMGYADSFAQLARSISTEEGEYIPDRMAFLENCRARENRLVLCSHLDEVSRIMSRVAGEAFSYSPMAEKEKRLLLKMLREEGYHGEGICYLSVGNDQRAVGILMRTDKSTGKMAENVADMLTVLLHRRMRLSAASPCLVDNRLRSFFFVEEPKFIVLTGYAKVVKQKEKISGDNYSFLESEQGRLTMLLSDGTGSGEKAGRDSGRVLDLMEKILESGFSLESAVKMVNSALFARNEDSNHPTLDICSFDLYSGVCDFCKVGGAASFLKRDKNVEEISICSLPLGIFRNPEAQIEQREVQAGDYVIMMSDGVLDAFGEKNYEEAFIPIISELAECNPAEMAERLLHQAFLACGGYIYDDMTILVAGVWENNRIS